MLSRLANNISPVSVRSLNALSAEGKRLLGIRSLSLWSRYQAVDNQWQGDMKPPRHLWQHSQSYHSSPSLRGSSSFGSVVIDYFSDEEDEDDTQQDGVQRSGGSNDQEPDYPPLFGTKADTRHRKFRISPRFVAQFKDIKPPFGFNGLGELVYQRTYARVKPDNSKEQWFETVERVVNGTYNMQKAWIEEHGLGWNARKAQRSAKEMYRRIFEMKFLPPGRGLWAMGTTITEDKRLYAALNNCAFVSTEDINTRSVSQPFCFLMDAAMLGVGVGFDTKGAGKITVKGFDESKKVEVHTIADSREGWVSSVEVLIEAIMNKGPVIQFDYSQIRPAGVPIKGFGGVSAGPGSLVQLHEDITKTLEPLIGTTLTVSAIVDIMNYIGVCVVSGNVRRTAEIAFGDPNNQEYIDLKNYEINPQRAAYGWTSNNSIFAELGMNYGPVCERVQANGEPGFAWLQNMQNYGRMNGVKDDRDRRAKGGNPCLEQTLESYELCCLVETFPHNHDTKEDYLKTLKYAYLYAKTVTLGKTHWPLTNRVMLRNRRIGCSMSGLAQFISNKGLNELRTWCEDGYNSLQQYDRQLSDWFAIPHSIKTTCIKPSGTVSLLAGATPGMHYPESRFYIRRMRLDSKSELVEPLREANYHMEPSVVDPATLVVSIPIDVGSGIRTAKDLPMWEQLSLAAFLQRFWADNQVSCTVTFDPEKEAGQLQHALDYFQYQLKGISFLPRLAAGAYPQMPYEEVTQEKYEEMVSQLKPLNFHNLVSTRQTTEVPDKFCEADTCEFTLPKKQA